MRRVLLLLLVPLGATAAEPDAAVAEAARWVEARGCASGSYRSRAAPVVTEVEEAWTLKADAIGSAPVHWDGRAYVVVRRDGDWRLLGLDLRTGEELASIGLKNFVIEAGIFVWDNMVLLQPTEKQINGYVLEGRRFRLKWIFRGRRVYGAWQHPSSPVVHDNEVYCFLGDHLARLRPGSNFPSWRTDRSEMQKWRSRPSVHGPHVFVATLGERGWWSTQGNLISTLQLEVYRRSDGARVAAREICQAAVGGSNPDLTVTVSGDLVCIGSSWPLPSTAGWASHVMVPKAIADRELREGELGLSSYNRLPALSRLGLVVVSGDPGDQVWKLYRDHRLWPLAYEKEQPDLFVDRVPPTVLGDVLYFGSWAMDLETREILWRLPFTDVTQPVVPADGLFLAVEGGRALRAFRGRGRR